MDCLSPTNLSWEILSEKKLQLSTKCEPSHYRPSKVQTPPYFWSSPLLGSAPFSLSSSLLLCLSGWSSAALWLELLHLSPVMSWLAPVQYTSTQLVYLDELIYLTPASFRVLLLGPVSSLACLHPSPILLQLKIKIRTKILFTLIGIIIIFCLA